MLSKKKLLQILKKIPESNWQKAICDNGKFIQWLEIFQYICPSTQLHHKFGLTNSGVWCCEWQGKVVSFDRNPLAFIVLIESKQKEIVQLIRGSLMRSSLPELVVTTFPLDELLLFAISDSTYWKKYAEHWIEDGYPLNDQIAEALPDNKLIKKWQNDRLTRLFTI
jgi:hypothetical protein